GRRLGERPEEDREREPDDPARKPAGPPCGEPREERQRDHDAADQTVAELDERVVVLLRKRVALLAAGPVAAAEAGVRQPDGGAGADDQPERAELGDRDHEKPRGAQLERPDARESARSYVHVMTTPAPSS